MPGNADPSRIYRDPALTDRRGDATGPLAFVFLFVLIAAFALVASLLVSLPAVVADPSPRPTPTPTIQPTLRPSPTPARTPGASGPAQPSGRPDRSAGPLPSRIPGAIATPRPPSVGDIGQPLGVWRDGRRVGGVTVLSFEVGEMPGRELPAGARIMVLEVRYTTSSGMAYDAADWVAVDADETRHESLGDDAPGEALGSGRLDGRGAVRGTVAFVRERRVALEKLVLTDGEGGDLVVVDRASGS